MPSTAAIAVAKATERLPMLRRLPVLRLLALGEVVLLAKDHIEKLEPQERRRLVVLVGRARGRASKLTGTERSELGRLIAKAEPRLFAGAAADKLSPVPLPDRVVRGNRTD
jgi:hypothetical protein